MGKYKFVAKIHSDNEKNFTKGICIWNDNKIIYKENNISVTFIYSNNRIEMNRKSNEYEIYLKFEKNTKTNSIYKFIGGNKEFILKTFTKKIIIGKNKFEIDYILEDNMFSYKLELEDL